MAPTDHAYTRMLTRDAVWDEDTAARYDAEEADGRGHPDALGPVVSRLAQLAGGGRALELAIGTGRVAVPLSRAGVPVAGIELSAPMVARLREKVDEATIPVVVGDMVSATAPGAFSLAYLVYNTIGNVLTQDEQVEVFRNAARHLEPGGRFVVETGVPELRRLTPGETAAVFGDEPGYLGVDTYEPVEQLLVSHHVTFDGDGPGREARIGRSAHRYVWPSELDLMARLAGMRLESRWADWDGSPFAAESRSHVSVYRVPGDSAT